jgi:hypothetical protein
MIFSLPGPTQVWQLFGFLLIGLAVGYGVSRNRRALGIFELALVQDRSVGLFGHREWEIYDDRSTAIGRRLKVDATGGRCKVSAAGHAREPVILAGTPLQGTVDLLNEDTLTIGDRKYRFRRMPDASVCASAPSRCWQWCSSRRPRARSSRRTRRSSIVPSDPPHSASRPGSSSSPAPLGG